MPENNNALAFVDEVLKQLEQKLEQEPYQINLLEEVHMHDNDREIVSRVKENAHSRILRALLSFQCSGNYIVLKSLIDYIKRNSDSPQWDSIVIRNPDKPQNERGRIDLLITQERDFALIFENKINNAVDQQRQIARYIRFVNEMGFPKECIFILYLSNQGENPSSQTWIDETTHKSYYDEFIGRFFNFSFKQHVFPWLKESVMPLIKEMQTEEILHSAVLQYINYLEKKYRMSKKDIDLKNFIYTQLGFAALPTNQKKLAALLHKIEDINLVLDYMNHIKNDLLINEYGSKYHNLTLVSDSDYTKISASNIDIAFAFDYKNDKYCAVVYRYNNGKDLYCGIFGWERIALSTEIKSKFDWLQEKNKRLFVKIKDYNDDLLEKLFSTANNLSDEA